VSEPLVRLAGVTKAYARLAENDGLVLRGIELEVRAGESLAIVGPSGSGKSTLLHVIGALDAPTAGTVFWEGRDLAALDERERARLRNRELGFVFQSHYLLPQLGALENVLVPSLARPASERGALERRGRELLAAVGLAGRLEHRPAELSGGERARVAVVRALVHRPRLLLADEPTGSLDRRAADELGELLVGLQASEGTALVVVTHSERLAARMARALVLENGRLAALR
jgi:lipoprotein-releasing system ATP-binding protein